MHCLEELSLIEDDGLGIPSVISLQSLTLQVVT